MTDGTFRVDDILEFHGPSVTVTGPLTIVGMLEVTASDEPR
ncbi:hypothetical protein [Herbiconiux sp. VKM Ac-2851]|nr:hypothetical protein [Herbiconiux sp. VKM Ac-2851]